MRLEEIKSKIDEFVKDRILIYLKKNKDYGDSFLQTLIKFGEVSALIRINDKVNRYINLLGKNVEVEDESVQDTILDLFNYCMMYKSYLENKNILLKDLVLNMTEECIKIKYDEDFEKIFMYKVIENDLGFDEECVKSIINCLKKYFI